MLKKRKTKDPEKVLEKDASPPGAQPATAAQDGDGTPAAEFSEPGVKDEIAALRAEVEKLKAERVTDKAASFAEGLVKKGKLPPKLKTALTTILTAADNTQAINFAEEEVEEPEEKTLLQGIMDFCEAAIPVQIPLTKIKRGKAATAGDDGSTDFAEKKGTDVDEVELEIYQKANALAKEKGIEFSEALAIVESENDGGEA